MCGPWSSCFLSRHCAMISEMFGTIRMPNRQIAAIVCLTPDENLEYYTRSARETNGIGNGLAHWRSTDAGWALAAHGIPVDWRLSLCGLSQVPNEGQWKPNLRY